MKKTPRSVAAYQQRIACSFFYSFAFFAPLREVFMKKEMMWHSKRFLAMNTSSLSDKTGLPLEEIQAIRSKS